MQRFTRLAVGFVVVAGCLATPATGGAATLPTEIRGCGDVDHSFRLGNDLSCGLSVIADGVTIDLGGHRLTLGTSGQGILVDGRDDVVVRNGVIDGGFFGVLVQGGSDRTTIEDIVVRGTSGGIRVDGGTGAVLRKNVVMGAGSGLTFMNLTTGVMQQNTVTRSVNDGITLLNASDSSVLQNRSFGNGLDGVLLNLGSSNNLIQGNELVANGALGIDVQGGSTGNTIATNVVTGNLSTGIAGGVGNIVKRNTATANTAGIASAGGGQVIQNTVIGNVSDGIGVSGSGNVVKANKVNENESIGIHVHDAGNTVTSNTANGNGGLGISAPDGTVGDGNKASANGDPAQCAPGELCVTSSKPLASVHITCTSSITEDIIVGNNLFCPTGGPTILASGITIDLGAHLIRGDGGIGDRGFSIRGDDVTLKNGTISGFDYGVHVFQAVGTTLTKLRIQRGVRGIGIFEASGTVASGNVITTNASNSIHQQDGDPVGSTFTKNLLAGNGGSGVVLFKGTDSELISNVMVDDGGVNAAGTTGSVIRKNTLRGAGSGIAGGATASVGQNFVEGGAGGIAVGAGGEIVKNIVEGNSGDGVHISTNAVIQGNRIVGNLFGIFVSDPGGGATTDAVITSNATLENLRNGIHTNDNSVQINGNTANVNGFHNGVPEFPDVFGYGVKGPPGTTGGGNEATGNASNVAQCDPVALCA